MPFLLLFSTAALVLTAEGCVLCGDSSTRDSKALMYRYPHILLVAHSHRRRRQVVQQVPDTYRIKPGLQICSEAVNR